jgi:hypothetical protein
MPTAITPAMNIHQFVGTILSTMATMTTMRKAMAKTIVATSQLLILSFSLPSVLVLRSQ